MLLFVDFLFENETFNSKLSSELNWKLGYALAPCYYNLLANYSVTAVMTGNNPS